ncbi:MAG: hypothetical protein FWB85_00425 [Chitinispirillia bacterium]|nr:hypothetical protein [Chitinispirillia bacterium]MCL2240947.1 hypothetical protein [Chitinispirillia bacterium]
MADGTNGAGDFLKMLNNAKAYFQALEKRISVLETKMAALGLNTGGNSDNRRDSIPASAQDAHAQSSASGIFEQQQPRQNTAEEKKDCLYFANGADGVFLKSSGSPDFLDRISLYCFEKINDCEAYVSAVDKLSVVRKFSSNPDALESFCEQLNLCGESSRGIETVERGKAVLEGDKWRISTKIKIHYY